MLQTITYGTCRADGLDLPALGFASRAGFIQAVNVASWAVEYVPMCKLMSRSLA